MIEKSRTDVEVKLKSSHLTNTVMSRKDLTKKELIHFCTSSSMLIVQKYNYIK